MLSNHRVAQALAPAALLLSLSFLPRLAVAADVLINDGGATTVSDGTYASDTVHIRNAGCPPGFPNTNVFDPCPSPGAATSVVFDAGSAVDEVQVYDSSQVSLAGGSVSILIVAGDTATVAVSGGSIAGVLWLEDSATASVSGGDIAAGLLVGGSTLTEVDGGTLDAIRTRFDAAVSLHGGSIAGPLTPSESSVIRVVGANFRVDGSPVPYGAISAQDGFLTGKLESGDAISVDFHQGGSTHPACFTPVCAGVVLLTPGTTVPAVGPSAQLLLIAGLVGCGAAFARRPRRSRGAT